MDIIAKMLDMKTWAVVGATDNKSKFGYKIFKVMLDAGYEVYPVNPGVTEILGRPCYKSIRDLPVVPQAVDMVVAPKVGETVVKECKELGIEYVWFQPGSSSRELIEMSQEMGLEVIEACVMVEIRTKDLINVEK